MIYVLLSVAAGDRQGLPDAETLEAVEGYTLLRTDRDGWIEITTDGEQMWVEAARLRRWRGGDRECRVSGDIPL